VDEVKRECRICKEIKPLGDFNKGNAKYGRKSECRVCQGKRHKEYKQRPASKIRDRQWNRERYNKRSPEEKSEIYHKRKDYVDNWIIKNPNKHFNSITVRSIRRQERMKNAGPIFLSSIEVLIDHNRLILSSTDKFTCEYCRETITDCSMFHLEHIIPIYHGGTNITSNLAIACRTCNLKKGKKLLKEFRPDLMQYFENRKL